MYISGHLALDLGAPRESNYQLIRAIVDSAFGEECHTRANDIDGSICNSKCRITPKGPIASDYPNAQLGCSLALERR